ncbi:MAG: hypothetical protein ACE5GO_05295 [Anaerolineales bacterium]
MSDTKTVGNGDLSILGSQCNADQVLALLGGWPELGSLSYRIWEYTDEIEIVENGNLPIAARIQYLERARLFGKGGDLTLRRVGEQFHWWFIGPQGISVPEKCKSNDFWQNGDPRAVFNQETHTALLWGSRDQDHHNFWEDRVAGANLSYDKIPALKDAERVAVEYVTYTRAGRVEFVWMKKLKPHTGGE